jgi:hypothetical protein
VEELTKLVVLARLSRYFFCEAIFCSLLGSAFLPPPLLVFVLERLVLFSTSGSLFGGRQVAFVSTSVSKVGTDNFGIACFLFNEGPARVDMGLGDT